MFSPYYGIWNPEMVTVYYHHPNTYYMADSLAGKELMEVVKYKRSEGANLNIYFLTFFTFTSLDTLDFADTLILSNQEYNDIEIFKQPNPDANYEWNKINPTELYWSKTKGLLKFKEQNGQVWTKIE
jgi:hypothetical protein